MTDLTFCYLHMTENDLQVIDTLETPDYLKGELVDDDFDIPFHMVPPNPEDTDALPSRTHPSYPYGNPTNVKHPAARPRPPYDPASRALFEDMGYAMGGGVDVSHRWHDLALEQLLPVDEAKEEALKAIEARKMAAGASNNQPQQQQGQVPPNIAGPPMGEELDDDDEFDEDEVDENEQDDVDDVWV